MLSINAQNQIIKMNQCAVIWEKNKDESDFGRKQIEFILQGEQILAQLYDELDAIVQSISFLIQEYLRQQEILNANLLTQLQKCEYESKAMLNNHNVLCPNPSIYHLINDLKIRININQTRKEKIKEYRKKASQKHSDLNSLDFLLTPIKKDVFADQLQEFVEAVNLLHSQVSQFEESLMNDRQTVEKELESEQKIHQAYGYMNVTKTEQSWIADFVNLN